MKALLLALSLLSLPLFSTAQEIEQTRKPTREWLDQIKAEPEAIAQFQTPELTIQEFQKYVDEVFEPTGEIKDGVESWKLFAIDLMAIFLAEHYQLRNLEPDAVIKKYGEPKAVYMVRKDSPLFQTFIRTMFISSRTDEVLTCFVYDNRYVWFIGGVFGISPRTERFDRYVQKQFKTEVP